MSGAKTPAATPKPGPPDRPRDAEDDVRFSVEHSLRRAARAPVSPMTAPRQPWYRNRIVRDVVVLVLAASIGLAIGAFADVANPDYPEARAIADRIDSTWRSIVTENADPQEAAVAAGLQVHTLEVAGRDRTILTHATPTAAGSCYAFRFGPGILSQAGILEEPSSGCTPLPPGMLEPSGSWSEVLPSERITPPWFVPAVVVLFVAALYAVTDIPLALLIRRQNPDPSRTR